MTAGEGVILGGATLLVVLAFVFGGPIVGMLAIIAALLTPGLGR